MKYEDIVFDDVNLQNNRRYEVVKSIIVLIISFIVLIPFMHCCAEDTIDIEWPSNADVPSADSSTIESNEINWSAIEPILNIVDIAGSFVKVSDTGLKIFIPSVFREEKLSGDALFNGYVFALQAEDDDYASVNVAAASYDGSTLEDLAAQMSEDEQFVTINGIPSIVEKWPDEIGITMQTVDGIWVWFSFYMPDSYQALETIIIASIQPDD